MSEIGVIYGDDSKNLVKTLLEKYGAFEDFSNRKNLTVGIKPNVLKASPSEEGATTDPEIVAGIIEYLKQLGIIDIQIIESAWVGGNTKRAFKACGYQALASKYDIDLYDLKEDDIITKKIKNEKIKVCKRALDVDFLINVPVLKAHCQTKITCAMKNLKGCIPDNEKRSFHTRGLHKPIALLNEIIISDLIIVDGIYGDLTFEEGGNPVKMDRLIIGNDPVLVDMYAARLLGYNYRDIEYIMLARKYRNDKISFNDNNVIEYNNPEKVVSTSVDNKGIGHRIANNINRESACSACLGNLIHALYRIQGGRTNNPGKSIYIGQGYKNKKNTNGIGIGSCTSEFDNYLAGCPPETDKIINFLNKSL